MAYFNTDGFVPDSAQLGIICRYNACGRHGPVGPDQYRADYLHLRPSQDGRHSPNLLFRTETENCRKVALNRHKNIDSDFSAANRKEEMMVLVELRRAIQRTNSMIIGRQSSIVHVLRCIKRTRLQYQEASKDFLTQAERLELVKGLIACEKLLPMEEDALKYIKNLNDMTIIRLTWDIDLMTLCKELCIHKETGGGDQERAGRSLDNLLALQSVDKMHHHEIRFMLTTLKENMAVIGRAEEFIWPVKQYCHKMDVAMGVHVPIGGLLGRHVIGTPSTDDAAATAGGRESKL